MKRKHIFYICSLCLVMTIIFSHIVCAHPGRTDANGGHWDREDGTYHFHTGEYAGKSSSGSSSKSEYKPFTPPYEPPTDNPYRENNIQKTYNDNNDSSNIWLYIVLGIGILCVFISCISSKFREVMIGLLYISISFASMFIIPLTIIGIISIGNLLEDEPGIGLLCIVTIIFIIVLCIKIKKCYSNISNYQKTLDETRFVLDGIEQAKKDADQLCIIQIPIIYEIGKDGLPKEKNSSSWGKTFTVYKTFKGNKLHKKRGCCSANIKKHICQYNHYSDLEQIFCQRCCGEYKTPDMRWYKNYLKYKSSADRYNKAKNNLNELHIKNVNIHKECNKTLFKIITFFDRKNRKELMNLNGMFNKLSSEMEKVKAYSIAECTYNYTELETEESKHDVDKKKSLDNCFQLSMLDDME